MIYVLLAIWLAVVTGFFSYLLIRLTYLEARISGLERQFLLLQIPNTDH